MTKPPTFSEADGLAALGICESLILELNERKIISNENLRGLLTDVVTTHIEAANASKRDPSRGGRDRAAHLASSNAGP
jgi:hypothetical protein